MFENKKQRKILFDENIHHSKITGLFMEKFVKSVFDDLKIPVLLTGCSSEHIPYHFPYEKAKLCSAAYCLTVNRSFSEVYTNDPNCIILDKGSFRKNQANLVKSKMEQQWPDAEVNLLSLGNGSTYCPYNRFFEQNDKSIELKQLMGPNFIRIDCETSKHKLSYLKHQAESQMPQVIQYYQENNENFRKSLERKNEKINE